MLLMQDLQTCYGCGSSPKRRLTERHQRTKQVQGMLQLALTVQPHLCQVRHGVLWGARGCWPGKLHGEGT